MGWRDAAVNHKHQRIIRWRKVSVTLVIAGQASITAYKNTIWWWEMGHLWGWNVLQVVKLRRDGVKGRVGVGVTSALATVQRKSKAKKMNVFLSFLQISLWHSFHCFIKMPEKKKNRAHVFQGWEPCWAPPRARGLESVWFTPRSLLMSETLVDTYFEDSCISATPTLR